jgi:hypothetical protein
MYPITPCNSGRVPTVSTTSPRAVRKSSFPSGDCVSTLIWEPKGRHRVGLLYQPLTFETISQFEEDVTIDTETFEAGQVVELVYGFDFWRGSYTYRFIDRAPWELDAGVSFQIRNASIRFRAKDESELVVSQDTGPVPVLRVRSRYTLPAGWWLEGEADGFYAGNAFINGAEYEFAGWIWDAAISAGAPVHPMAEAYLTLRSIGGGARGTATDRRDTWTQSQAGGDERYTKTQSLRSP